MTTLAVRDELIFDLVSQSSSGVYLRDGMLWRSLRFEASVDSRSALHDPLLKEGGRPVASVSLQQADDKGLIAGFMSTAVLFGRLGLHTAALRRRQMPASWSIG
jgi:hypothetical protein